MVDEREVGAVTAFAKGVEQRQSFIAGEHTRQRLPAQELGLAPDVPIPFPFPAIGRAKGQCFDKWIEVPIEQEKFGAAPSIP